jgi:hypothetical protein
MGANKLFLILKPSGSYYNLLARITKTNKQLYY